MLHKEIHANYWKNNQRLSVTDNGEPLYLYTKGRRHYHKTTGCEIPNSTYNTAFFYGIFFLTYAQFLGLRETNSLPHEDWFDKFIFLTARWCSKQITKNITNSLQGSHKPWCVILFQGDTVGNTACYHWCRSLRHKPPWWCFAEESHGQSLGQSADVAPDAHGPMRPNW